MDMNLYDRLGEYGEHHHFRASFLKSDFCKQTTMQNILDDPDETLEEISLIRGVGETSLSRLRQVLVREFSERFPKDWEAARSALLQRTEPEGAQAQKLARFITVWNVIADHMVISGRYYPDYDKASNRVMLDSLVRGEPFIYVCESFPEILKTPDVLYAEQGQNAEKTDYQQRLSGLRDHMPPLAPGSLVLLDANALDALLAGTGYYRDLPEATRMQQIKILLGFAATLPDLDTCVADYRKIGLSSGFLSGDGPLLHYCFGGYIEMTAPDLVPIFHEKVAQARAQGAPLADWVASRTAPKE